MKCFYFDLGLFVGFYEGTPNQLVDIGTMHSLGMDNWNLKLIYWFMQILLLKRLNGHHQRVEMSQEMDMTHY